MADLVENMVRILLDMDPDEREELLNDEITPWAVRLEVAKRLEDQ